ncbi:GntR family transcriptional regulator [soil metagenome]
MTLLSDEVYFQLKRRLTLWEYLPGTRIPEAAIAAEFAVSRTPVRDALRRLEQERFLESQPWSGYRAIVPNMRRMEELYEVRLALEETAVRQLTSRADQGNIEALVAEWDQIASHPEPNPDLVHADERFHETLAGLAGNQSLLEYLRSINEHIRIIRVNDFGTSKRISDTCEEHLALLHSIRQKQVEDAIHHLQFHIRQSQSMVREAAERALSKLLLNWEEPGRAPSQV